MPGDMTIDAWVCPSAVGAYQFVLGSAAGSGGLMWALNMGAAGNMAVGVSGIGWPMVFTGVNLSVGQWAHVAVCRSAGVARCYVNGVQAGAAVNDATSYALSGAWVGGQSGGSSFTGAIDSIRVTKAARYTSAFTPGAFASFGA